jgi:hypothetical protein
LNYKGSHSCGCQRFKPQVDNPETCKACKCDEAFLEQTGPVGFDVAAGHAASAVAGQGTSELEQTDQAEGSKLPLEAGAEAGGVGKSQAGQKSQRRDAMQLGGSGMGQSAAAHGQGNAKAGSSEKEPASKRARLVCESGREVAKAGVYDELLEDFWKKFPEEEFGKFEMKQVKLDWKVHCVACKKDLAPGQLKYKLKNVEIHVEEQRKEGKMPEHMAAFGKAKERAAMEAQQAKSRAEDVMGKPKALLQQYRGEGRFHVLLMAQCCDL